MNDTPAGDGGTQTPKREVVQRDPTQSRALRPVKEMAEGTPVGEAYVASLLKVQRALAIQMSALLVAFLVVIVGALAALSARKGLSIAGIPVVWFVLGIGAYVVFVGIAAVFVRRSERNEAEFVAIIRESR